MRILAFCGLILMACGNLEAQAIKPRACPPASLSGLSPAARTDVGQLRSVDAGVRATFVEALGEKGAASVPTIPWILPLLQDENSVIAEGRRMPVAFIAATALARIGPPALGCVLSMLADPALDRDQRAALLRVAAVVGTPEFAESAIKQAALFTPAPTERYDSLFPSLVYTLGCFLPDRRAFDALLQLGGHRSDEFLLSWLNKATGQTFTTLSAATGWWARAGANATLSRVRWEFYCYVPGQ